MNKRLYVGNLSYDVTSAALTELFAQAGKVENAEVIAYEATGRSKGFGFVEMATEEDAQAAIKKFDGVEHEGRTLSVEPARPKKDRKVETVEVEEKANTSETEEVEADTTVETEEKVEVEETEAESEKMKKEAEADLR